MQYNMLWNQYIANDKQRLRQALSAKSTHPTVLYEHSELKSRGCIISSSHQKHTLALTTRGYKKHDIPIIHIHENGLLSIICLNEIILDQLFNHFKHLKKYKKKYPLKVQIVISECRGNCITDLRGYLKAYTIQAMIWIINGQKKWHTFHFNNQCNEAKCNLNRKLSLSDRSRSISVQKCGGYITIKGVKMKCCAKYCSKHCQKKAWKCGHRLICRKSI